MEEEQRSALEARFPSAKLPYLERSVVPAVSSLLLPLVKVLRRSMLVDHGVDRGASAEHLAAGLVHVAVVALGLRDGAERPFGGRAKTAN